MKTLIDLTSGETGVIRQINGGRGLIRRLHSLGIHEKVKVKKVSNAILRGPVVISINNREIALGRGMAAKIYVE